MDKKTDRSANGFNRISKVLSYIHSNLHQTLHLDELAEQSCWSRWQLQRVFQAETGLSVAMYVRELKLSQAAEQLINSPARVIDIALALGFNSEMSFSRSFKQMFGISPRAYRKLGVRTGLRKPIEPLSLSDSSLPSTFAEVRVESKGEFFLKGVHGEIHGLFSVAPNFQEKVPELWRTLEGSLIIEGQPKPDVMGVIDVTQSFFDGSNIHYWAGIELDDSPLLFPSLRSRELETLLVPAQTYAIIKHRGPVSLLPKTLEWFLLHWLPNSGYSGVDGFELECYPATYDPMATGALMEYWVPIQ